MILIGLLVYGILVVVYGILIIIVVGKEKVTRENLIVFICIINKRFTCFISRILKDPIQLAAKQFVGNLSAKSYDSSLQTFTLLPFKSHSVHLPFSFLPACTEESSAHAQATRRVVFKIAIITSRCDL